MASKLVDVAVMLPFHSKLRQPSSQGITKFKSIGRALMQAGPPLRCRRNEEEGNFRALKSV